MPSKPSRASRKPGKQKRCEPEVLLTAVKGPLIVHLKKPLDLAELTLKENGQWLIQAKVNFVIYPEVAPTTGLVTCRILAGPVGGLPTTLVDEAELVLSMDFPFQFVPYLGTVTVHEPTRVYMHCSNFMLDMLVEPVRAFNIRLAAMWIGR